MTAKKVIVYFLSILIVGCVSTESGSKEEINQDHEEPEALPEVFPEEANETIFSIEKNGIKLTAVGAEKEYKKASLKLNKPSEEILVPDKVAFEFTIEDFELGAQTEGMRNDLLAASEKGQHIHFILNNGPYTAYYTSTFEKELAEGNNVILAFLARSYHESVKGSNAFVFRNLSIGENNPPFDLKAPHLIYSRPKGVYEKKVDPLLLDFYLINTKLSESGMQVRTTIDGTEFMLSSWQAYLIEGLAEGEHSIRIQLIDQNGKVVPGPFNDSGERTIVLKQ